VRLRVDVMAGRRVEQIRVTDVRGAGDEPPAPAAGEGGAA